MSGPTRHELEQHPGFRLIRIAGGPYERGLQHGQLLRDQLRRMRDLLYSEVIYFRGWAFGLALQSVMAPMLLTMQRYIPRELREEMHGIAQGAEVPYRDVLILNCFDDLLHGLWLIPINLARVPKLGALLSARFACSSFALLGERSRDGRVLHGRNLDYEVAVGYLAADGAVTRALKENVVVIDCQPERGHAFLSVSWPGMVGVVTSLSESGISLACLTSTVNGETPNGMPLQFLYRLIAQYAGRLDHAEQLIRETRRTIGNNLLVASATENDARVFELSPRRVAVRHPENDVLVTTNHFMHEHMTPEQQGWVIPNSLDRNARLQSLCGTTACDWETVGSYLRDTHSLAADGNLWSCLENPGTIYSTVTDPARGRMWLRANDDPQRTFVELTGSWASGWQHQVSVQAVSEVSTMTAARPSS